MYERFTDRARKIMQLANGAAVRLGCDYIGSEHLLLGLLEEGSGVAARVMKNLLELPPPEIRARIEALIQAGSITDRDKSPGTPTAKQAVFYAMQEARDMGHNCVGTEHLLVGLLRANGAAASALTSLGLGIDQVRAEVLRVLAEGENWGRHRFVDWPTLSPRPMPATTSVSTQACPKCGHRPMTRVLWWKGFVSPADQSDLEAGAAILGSTCDIGVEEPTAVCLRWMPRWIEVHRLASRDYELNFAKENAVVSFDFASAARMRDEQTELRQQLRLLIQELAAPK